jgi:tetratricopeptide (TPR) repeat protein
MPEPELRYPGAREFADDLIMFRAGGPVRAMAEDLDATRRTAPRPNEADETRRTAPAAALAKPPDGVLNWPPKAVPVRKPRGRGARRALLYLFLAVLVFAGLVSLNGYLLYKRGQKLETAIETEQVTSPAEIWTRWTELSKDNPSSLSLTGARQAVKQRLVEAADRVISSYRNTGAVYENGWKGAHDELMHALSLGPDESVRGKLRLAEGHLARITGETRHRQADLNDALEKFSEAERLLPGSPDPPLAEARLELQSLQDFDRAYSALQLAEKRGYAGKSERGELANAYRDRANREFWSSRDVRDLPQEKDLVARARDDYQRSMDLYRSIVPYGDSVASIQSVQESLDSVNFRLNTIEHPPAEPTAPQGILEKLRHIWR